jgi:hypothetical protein
VEQPEMNRFIYRQPIMRGPGLWLYALLFKPRLLLFPWAPVSGELNSPLGVFAQCRTTAEDRNGRIARRDVMRRLTMIVSHLKK